jgi:methionyl-tRNA formyltransferase
MKIQILVDNSDSWIVPYARELQLEIIKKKHDCLLLHYHEQVEAGDVLCLLSCEKIFKTLNLNKYNLVVHESDLPKGKGWSPVTWQVLEGVKKIPVTLFEAEEAVDAGEIYAKENIILKGDELLPEIKNLQGIATKNLIHKFIDKYPEITGTKQTGPSTFYAKRKAKDSELDIDKPIREHFNLLRVCDNERYPAFFILDNTKYILKIYKDDKEI